MIEAIDRIISIVGDATADKIADNRDALDSLCWNYMRLGEAASQLPQDLVASHPDIPWRRASALRNRIVHGYRSVDAAVLTDTARTDLPAMRVLLIELRRTS